MRAAAFVKPTAQIFSRKTTYKLFPKIFRLNSRGLHAEHPTREPHGLSMPSENLPQLGDERFKSRAFRPKFSDRPLQRFKLPAVQQAFCRDQDEWSSGYKSGPVEFKARKYVHGISMLFTSNFEICAAALTGVTIRMQARSPLSERRD